MKCLNQDCNATDIEKDDNFCYKCGHYTTKGHAFLSEQKNVDMIVNGATIKQQNRLSLLFSLLAASFLLFLAMLIIRGDDLFKPFFYLKKQAFNYLYGYNTSLMKTDHKYNKVDVSDYESAISLIKEDFKNQSIFCFNEIEVDTISHEIEEFHKIPSVSFCDASSSEANKIKEVVDKMYLLFTDIEGALTNITITNAEVKTDYIARFQPMYQFVNINEDINEYNKVNKTQILINSFYFLNKDTLSKSIEKVAGEGWYVEDATWESTIAHELGHYISFVTLLRKNNIDNITLVTKDNEKIIDNIMEEFNSGSYSYEILDEALRNYNYTNNTSITMEEFASSISKYAASKDESGNIIADETIAEAIHDYYLHTDNMKDASSEIVNVIKSRL